MTLRSIGVRLTVWYAGIMAVALLLFCGGLWLALEHSLYHAIDESLRDRVAGVRQFIVEQTGWLTIEEIQQEFREHSVLGPGGDLFQVADADGKWLYRSDPLYDEHAPVYRQAELGSELRFENVAIQDTPLRFLSQAIDVQGRVYTVQVAAPLRELERGLDEFLWAALPAIPLILVIASLGGYWISRRALQPVDRITETARSIGANNLSQRLAVHATGDELERLSRTLNEMIARLEASFNQITRFTADASHELRTPLALMRTTADVALRGSSETERVDALQEIVAELERTSHLVDNLLLMARVDAGESHLDRRPVDLADAVREACTQVAVLARTRGVVLNLSIPDVAIEVSGNREALRRLALLLLDNAIKYTPPDGHIEVAIQLDETAVVWSVSDTGIGISEQDLSHIFDRFYRVDAARSRQPGGVGLGLSIGRWIVDAHDGVMTVESTVGQGSTFTVRLPIRP